MSPVVNWHILELFILKVNKIYWELAQGLPEDPIERWYYLSSNKA